MRSSTREKIINFLARASENESETFEEWIVIYSEKEDELLEIFYLIFGLKEDK